jgi:hypothetical protein
VTVGNDRPGPWPVSAASSARRTTTKRIIILPRGSSGFKATFDGARPREVPFRRVERAGVDPLLFSASKLKAGFRIGVAGSSDPTNRGWLTKRAGLKTRPHLRP